MFSCRFFACSFGVFPVLFENFSLIGDVSTIGEGLQF